MHKPLISIIVPTYNRPHVLCENLECLSRQTFTDFEVIIVNDGGTAVDFVTELYPKLDITVVNLDHNRRHVHARNSGVEAAQGLYIMLCDDDDLLLPGHIGRMLEEIADSDLVYSDVEIFDYKIEGNTRIPVSRLLFAYDYNLEEMKKFSTFVSSGCLYRKELHAEIGPFDPEMDHYWDWDFFLRAARRRRVRRVPVASALYAFSRTGDNMSGDLQAMEPYLRKLSEKHELGPLPVKNFFLLLEEPDVKKREAPSEVVWDGLPIVSRLAQKQQAISISNCVDPGEVFVMQHHYGFVSVRKPDPLVTVGGADCDVQGFSSMAVQRAVEIARSKGGGTVLLSEGNFDVYGPIRLYDGIQLRGAGEATVLQKRDGFQTSFVIDADYGELQATVQDVSGFQPGVGIQLFDSANASGWGVSTAVVTAVEGNTIYFDEYLARDYSAEREGVISTACSIIEGVGAVNIVVSDLVIDGNKRNNGSINGCRGGAIYLHKAQDCLIERVIVRDFNGDGISWQTTDRITVSHCEVTGCTNFGLHPGTGSFESVVEHCSSHGNGSDGLFVCWRVQRGTFRHNRFVRNGGSGVSIGHKDTDNTFAFNVISENGHCGIYVRKETQTNGAHRNRYVGNTIADNGPLVDRGADAAGEGSGGSGGYGIYLQAAADDTHIECNIIEDTGPRRQRAAIRIGAGVSGTKLLDNQMSGQTPGVDGVLQD